jgi:hypothetical protein
LKLKNSWEELPLKTGNYFAIDHCGKKDVLIFEREHAAWYRIGVHDALCPKCEVFQWIDMEAE